MKKSCNIETFFFIFAGSKLFLLYVVEADGKLLPVEEYMLRGVEEVI